MFIHPDFLLTQYHSRQRELIAEADRRRLLAAARRGRRARGGANADNRPLARGRPAGTLAPCDPRAVVPVR